MALSVPAEPPRVRTIAHARRCRRAVRGVTSAVTLPAGAPEGLEVLRLDLGDPALDGLGALLCEHERARAARLLDERNRTLWTRSRAALRALLGRYAERDPRGLVFELGPHGKPALRGAGELRFNLSHSGELMLVAVAAGREVGVDVESKRERYSAGFLRAWTSREATVKCLGTGLAHAPAGLGHTSASVDEPGRGNRGCGAWAVEGEGTLLTAELDVGQGAFAAVTVDTRSAPYEAPSAFQATIRKW